jgi:hypothetical protein
MRDSVVSNRAAPRGRDRATGHRPGSKVIDGMPMQFPTMFHRLVR